MRRVLFIVLSLVFLGSSASMGATWPPIPKIKKPKLPGGDLILDDTNKKRINRGNAAMDEVKINNGYTASVKPEDMDAVKQYLNLLGSKLSTAKRALKQLDMKYKKHPKAKALQLRVDKAQPHYEAVSANYQKTEEDMKAKAAANKAARRELTEAARAFRLVHKKLGKVEAMIPFLSDESAAAYKGSVFLNSKSDVDKYTKPAKTTLESCNKETFVYSDQTYKTADAMKGEEKLAQVCEAAKNAKAALGRMYVRRLAEGDDFKVKTINETIERVKNGKGWMRPRFAMHVLRVLNGNKWSVNANTNWLEEFDKRAAMMCEYIGIKMPADPFPKRTKAFQTLAAAVDTASKSWGYWPKDAKFKDANAMKALRKTIEKPEKLKKGGMWTKDWSIRKNGLGIPLRRDKNGYSITHVKGDKLCRLKEFRYIQPYKGGGKYQKSTAVSFNDTMKLVRCK